MPHGCHNTHALGHTETNAATFAQVNAPAP